MMMLIANFGQALAVDETLSIIGDGVTTPIEFTRGELEAMQGDMVQYIYSSQNNFPTKKLIAAKGIPLAVLLEKAGIKPEAQLITIKAFDGYNKTFTRQELLEDTRYTFPNIMANATNDAQPVETIISLMGGRGDEGFEGMRTENLKLCMGQRAMTEQTNPWFVKNAAIIEVSNEMPEKCEAPEIELDTQTLVAGPGLKFTHLDFDKVKIYYTTDSSKPDFNSGMFNISTTNWQPQLNVPILLDEDRIFKAIAIEPGKRNSEVVSITCKKEQDEIVLISPSIEKTIKPGNCISIMGTGQDKEQRTINVIDSKEKMIYTQELTINDGQYGTKFTLDHEAAEGYYTIEIKEESLETLYTYQFEVKIPKITLTTPVELQKFMPEDQVNISGTVENISSVIITVTDPDQKQVYAKEVDTSDSQFTTSFVLPLDSVGGDYTISIGGEYINTPYRYLFKVKKAMLASPTEEQIFKAGDLLEIRGTAAQNVSNLTAAVKDKNGESLLTPQVSIDHGVFTASLVVDNNLEAGEYTVEIDGEALDEPCVRKIKIVGTVELLSPQANQIFKTGENVQISGIAKNLSAIQVEVRNKNQEIIHSKELIISDEAFATHFELEADDTVGKYNIKISGEGLQLPYVQEFSVETDEGNSGEEPDEEIVLTVDGAVEENVDFTLRDLRNMGKGKIEDIYYALNSYGTQREYEAIGVSLMYLLEKKVELESDAKSITIIAKDDGYSRSFNIKDLKGRYRDHTVPILSWKSRCRSYNVLKEKWMPWEDDWEEDVLKPIIGQRSNKQAIEITEPADKQVFNPGQDVTITGYLPESNNAYFVDDVSEITVSTKSVEYGSGSSGKYDEPKTITVMVSPKDGASVFEEEIESSNGEFSVSFTLEKDAVSGEYEITISEEKSAKICSRKFQVDGEYEEAEEVLDEEGISIYGDVEENSYFALRDLKNMSKGKVNDTYDVVCEDGIHKEYEGYGISIPYLLQKEIDLDKNAKSITIIGNEAAHKAFNIEDLKGIYEDHTIPVLSWKYRYRQYNEEKNKWSDWEEWEEEGLKFIVSQRKGCSEEVNALYIVNGVTDISVSDQSVEYGFESMEKLDLPVAIDHFTDLKDHWAREEIRILIEKGIVNGVSDTEFAPDASITRAQFTKLLVKVLDLNVNEIENVSFEDVSSDAWYYKFVSAAVQAGLINGYNVERFGPDDLITREQMAVIVARAMKIKDMDEEQIEGDRATFKDQSEIAAGFENEIALALDKGVIKGVSQDTFAPKENATRAQGAVMILRFYNLLNEAG